MNPKKQMGIFLMLTGGLICAYMLITAEIWAGWESIESTAYTGFAVGGIVMLFGFGIFQKGEKEDFLKPNAKSLKFAQDLDRASRETSGIEAWAKTATEEQMRERLAQMQSKLIEIQRREPSTDRSWWETFESSQIAALSRILAERGRGGKLELEERKRKLEEEELEVRKRELEARKLELEEKERKRKS